MLILPLDVLGWLDRCSSSPKMSVAAATSFGLNLARLKYKAPRSRFIGTPLTRCLL